VGDIYNSYSEAEKELSKFKNKYAQVKIIEMPKKVTEDLRKWFKEKWVRFGPDGKIRGDCARGDDSEGKPKCLPQKKAQSLGKKGRKYAASKKRREDPNPERSGPAKNVATKKKSNENVTEGADVEYIVVIRDEQGKRSIRISALTPTDAKEKAEAQGHKVLKVKDPLEKHYFKEQDATEKQIDELKCWPGYTRVQGVPAGAPGSCKKKTNEEDLGMTEGQPIVSVKKWAEQVRQEHGVDTKFWNDKVHNRIIARKDKQIVGSYDRKANNGTVFSPEQDMEFKGELDSKGRFTKDTVEKMFGKLSPDAKNIKEEISNQGVVENVDKETLRKELLLINSLIKAMKYGGPAISHLLRKKEEILTQLQGQKSIKEEKCPHCAGPMFSEALMMEKKDACYYKVKSRYKVWPSAYASGALVKCRKKGAKNWGTKSESAIMRGIQNEEDI
jgi:hypothetical protein